MAKDGSSTVQITNRKKIIRNKALNVPKTLIIYKENIIRKDHLEKTQDQDGSSKDHWKEEYDQNRSSTECTCSKIINSSSTRNTCPGQAFYRTNHRQEKYDQDKSSCEKKCAIGKASQIK